MNMLKRFLARALRRPLDAIIETLYPNGGFFGPDYLKAFDRANTGTSHTGEGAAAFYLISKLSLKYNQQAEFSLVNVTMRGVPQGDWSLVVRQTRKPEDPVAPESTGEEIYTITTTETV